jgi:opacity protein-like surface antigen
MRHTLGVLCVIVVATATLATAPVALAQADPSGPAPAASDQADRRGAGDGRPRGGAYVAGSGFFLGLTDTDFRDTSFTSAEADIEGDDGWGAGLALGLRGASFRVEGEVVFRQNDLEVRGSTPVIGAVSLDGDVSALALMGNLYFEPWIALPLKPYLGAGLGGARVAFEAEELDADDTDWVLAYQGMAGLAVDLAPDVAIFGGYRYFATDEPAIEGTDIEYRTHNLELGLRFTF